MFQQWLKRTIAAQVLELVGCSQRHDPLVANADRIDEWLRRITGGDMTSHKNVEMTM